MSHRSLMGGGFFQGAKNAGSATLSWIQPCSNIAFSPAGPGGGRAQASGMGGGVTGGLGVGPTHSQHFPLLFS